MLLCCFIAHDYGLIYFPSIDGVYWTLTIVEGEKAADAAQKLLPNHAVLSWAGGVGAINKADWSPLVGRDITIWPDNDVPGQKAATQITQELAKLNQSAAKEPQIKIVDLPNDLPAKWDLADKMPETLTVDKIHSLVSVPQRLDKSSKILPSTQELFAEMAKEYKDCSLEDIFKDIQRRQTSKKMEHSPAKGNKFDNPVEALPEHREISKISTPKVSSIDEQIKEMQRQQLDKSMRQATGKGIDEFEDTFNKFMEKNAPSSSSSSQSVKVPYKDSYTEASSFMKEYERYKVSLERNQLTPIQQKDFEKKAFEFTKNTVAMGHIKSSYPRIGKSIENLANSHENQQQSLPNKNLGLTL